MLIAEKPFSGSITLGENKMPNNGESSRAERSNESVNTVPAVERYGKGVGFKQSIQFGERGFEPHVCVIVRHWESFSRFEVHEIRRIGQHEVHAVGGKFLQQFNAIAIVDGIEPRIDCLR